MDTVEDNMDEIILKIFDTMETLYRQQEILEETMKQGYLGISRSRYLLGVKRISLDQVAGAEMTANYTTEIDESLFSPSSETKWMTTGLEDDMKLIQLSDSCVDKMTDRQQDTVERLPTQGHEDFSGVRKRTVASGGENTNGERVKDVKPEKKKEEVKGFCPEEEAISSAGKKTNPLSHFGVLVPGPLRNSHKHFVDALKISVNIADLQCKLKLLQTELKNLRMKKMNMGSES